MCGTYGTLWEPQGIWYDMTNKDPLNNLGRLTKTLPELKSQKRLREIWFYNVLLCKSERESDFVIFGCKSECETIKLAIPLVCLICNISLLRETQCPVAVSVVSIHCSSGRSGPGAVQGLDMSLVKHIYLLAAVCPECWCLVSSSQRSLPCLCSPSFLFNRGASYPD